MRFTNLITALTNTITNKHAKISKSPIYVDEPTQNVRTCSVLYISEKKLLFVKLAEPFWHVWIATCFLRNLYTKANCPFLLRVEVYVSR